ncbi:hypothetical protein EGM70_10750 [Enterobacteriaceae bacterium 89]|nr:hypothetical protein [Enterobacteriaceae bacterium 89]
MRHVYFRLNSDSLLEFTRSHSQQKATNLD